jgi:hypothetical protein
VPPQTYVSRIEPSRFDSATFYVTFDGHRTNDFTPYVYVTTDFGRTFRAIANNLPKGGPDFVHVIREDPTNRDLLFVGTDVGAYVSLNRGASWQKFMTNLPVVPVHDLKIHPRDRELIAGTHGRSIWIVDIAPLQMLSDSVLTADAYLFQPKVAYQYGQAPLGGGSPGHKLFRAQSPQYGAEIVYRLAKGSDDRRARTRIAILDAKGDTVRSLTGPARAGVHRVTWNFAGPPPKPLALSPSQRRDSAWTVRRVEVVFDSLIKAGGNEQMLSGIKQGLLAGDLQGLAERFGFGGGGGGGGGGNQPTVRAGAAFVERPGETQARAATAGAAGGGGAGGATSESSEGADAAPDAAFVGQLAALLRRPGQGGGGGGGFGGLNQVVQAIRGPTPPGAGGGGGGGGGFGGGGAPPVTAGDYQVGITVDGKTLTRVLRVERGGAQ